MSALAAGSGCASSLNAVREQRAGDRQMQRGQNAAEAGHHGLAAEAFVAAHLHFTQSERLANGADASRPAIQAAAWREAGDGAGAAAPHAALGAAAAHYQTALLHWGKGDRLFDAHNFPAAIEAYENAEASYAEEERWLRVARRRMATQSPESETVGPDAARSVQEDLAKNRDERALLAGNIGRARVNEEARSARYWAGVWGGFGDAGVVFLDFTAHCAMMALHILVEPVFWECVFGIVRVVCVVR